MGLIELRQSGRREGAVVISAHMTTDKRLIRVEGVGNLAFEEKRGCEEMDETTWQKQQKSLE